MSWLTYLLQVNIYLSVFYIFYLVLLRNETFFQYNRVYLLATAFASLLIPVAQSEWIISLFISDEVYQAAADINPVIILAEGTSTKSGIITLNQIIALFYTAGVVLFSTVFMMKLARLRSVLSKTPVKKAFSFFNWIRVDKELAHNNTIYEHERVHAQQLHSADNIFFELLIILNWFNPIVYGYRKALKQIHEFIADEIAAQQEPSKAEYALILLSNTMGTTNIQLTNNFFNHSFLKRRIYMLQKQRSNRIGIVKYALSTPLFIAMMTYSSATLSKVKIPALEKEEKAMGNYISSISDSRESVEQAPALESPGTKVEELREKRPDASKLADTSLHEFSSIDVLPEFPGGQMAFYEYIGSEFKYPEEARRKGLKGRVTLNFIVEKDGSLSDIKIIREPGFGTGEEAVRVLRASPKWKPGIEKGEPVRVEYTLPIQLELAADDKEEPEKKTGIELKGPESPLYLLDATEITKAQLDNLDKSKIQSVYVLKDATAIVKYGDKGKNGVVVITSKK